MRDLLRERGGPLGHTFGVTQHQDLNIFGQLEHVFERSQRSITRQDDERDRAGQSPANGGGHRTDATLVSGDVIEMVTGEPTTDAFVIETTAVRAGSRMGQPFEFGG